MEHLTLRYEAAAEDGTIIHFNFYPTNSGLPDRWVYGCYGDTGGTMTEDEVAATLAPIAKTQLLVSIGKDFPGRYA